METPRNVANSSLAPPMTKPRPSGPAPNVKLGPAPGVSLRAAAAGGLVAVGDASSLADPPPQAVREHRHGSRANQDPECALANFASSRDVLLF